MSDPFGGDDDWLPSSLLGAADEPGFPADFLSGADGLGMDKLPDTLLSSDDELDQLFEQPNRSTAMRHAYSMNDLQSLQHLEAQPSWHSRGASVKPTLESVPEGGPAAPEPLPMPASLSAGSWMGPAQMPPRPSHIYQSPPDYSTTSPFQPHVAVPAAPAPMEVKPPAPAPVPMPVTYMAQHPPPHAITQQEHAAAYAPMVPPMYSVMSYHQGHPMSMAMPMAMAMAPGMPPTLPPGMAPALPPGMAHMPGVPTMPVSMMQARSSVGSEMATSAPPPGYAVQGSPEHQMTDVVKPEPSADTDSSGNSHPQPPKLQPTAAALRKSHSALELGAWRKMAMGDLDFVDPSGSIREALNGPEMCHQIGKLTPEERLQKILRYRAKRQMRNFNRTIKYQCRKSLADTRPRVRGRFARDNEPGSVMPHETKKALREKGKGGSPPPPDAGEQQPAGTLGQASQGTTAQPTGQGQGQGQMQHAAPQPGSQGAPAGSPTMVIKEEVLSDASLVTGPGGAPVPAHGLSSPADNHVIGLAHLYNAWSEVGPEATRV